jgi:hypothetical protein
MPPLSPARDVQMPFRESFARAAVPLAVLAAASAFAAHEVDRVGAAETGYLGAWAAAALAAVAALAPAPAWELGVGATLAVTVLWTLPDGLGRGAALALLLVATLGIAAARRLGRALSSPSGLPASVAIPLCLGLQVLLRGDRLLAPRLDLATLNIYIGLPLAAGLALTVLARREGGALALLAGGTVALLAPGWSPASALALVALAAGSVLGAGAEYGRLARGLAVVLLVGPLAWEPRAGLAGALSGLALAAPRWALLPALACAVAARLIPPAAGGLGFGIVTLPLLVPAFLLAEARRWERPAVALLLTVAARAIPGPAALAAPLALAALGLKPREPGVATQGVWTGALLFGSCLLASYPWLHPAPLADLPTLLGPVRTVAAVAVAALLAISLAGVFRTVTPARAGAVAAALLFLALALHIPRPGIRLLRPEQAVRLAAETPVWEAGLAPGTRVSELAIESVLSNGSELPADAPVGVVRLSGAPGGVGGVGEITFPLRAGRETGEWAARRPDVARALAGKPAPSIWMGWVAGSFFGERYRTLLPLPQPRELTRLRIERLPGLPKDLEIAVQQVEVRP